LRRFSLDELPQLWNVLIGEMSLVGPRPPVPGEYKQYDLEHLRRLDVTPGLTGLWQVTARQDPSFESYISLDLEYVENWSPLLDLKLLLRTVPVVLRGTGQ
jgi:lipopolysaccharide/colanic/teichoic acid biosynthesis glycosyltransferase